MEVNSFGADPIVLWVAGWPHPWFAKPAMQRCIDIAGEAARANQLN